ncbi:hypothetical protein J7E99_38585 [Streptomyces sp. ISL-44]|uniref:hypothetical protein n=1 Tax=Streptomyces sp. ISL-44 TaxID=2819184 RepID=UPI001BE849CA|nr:hypothetical protein [Streptomyces sp. ISL-44]MBT2546413.1 hypothetical protein [Streptomyces sp. ISL-44]
MTRLPFVSHGAGVVALQPAEQEALNFTFTVVTAPVAPVMVTATFSFHFVPLAGRTALLETFSVPVPTSLPLVSLSVYSTVRLYTQYPKRLCHHVPRVVIVQLPVSAAAAAAAAGGAAARDFRQTGVTGVAIVVTQACTAPALRSRESAGVGSHFSSEFTVAGWVLAGMGTPVESPGATVVGATEVGEEADATWPSSAAAVPVAVRLNARRRPGSIRLLRGEIMSSLCRKPPRATSDGPCDPLIRIAFCHSGRELLRTRGTGRRAMSALSGIPTCRNVSLPADSSAPTRDRIPVAKGSARPGGRR